MKNTGRKTLRGRRRIRARRPSAGASHSRPIQGALVIRGPEELNKISIVIINGMRLVRAGTQVVVTRTAPVKYTDDHFREVDALVQAGHTYSEAYAEVAERFGFSIDSFGRQYRDRHANEKVKPSASG